MKKQFYLVFAMLFLCAHLSSFAGVMKGKVTDAKGEELPFATVYVQGTTIGTSTNADAEYALQLQPGSYKVVCQYMGFQQSIFNVSITGSEVLSHNFSLQEQSLEMKGVTVKANAEDPAYAIMRKVIKRRKFHLEQVKSFQSGIYMKGVVRNRSMPSSIKGVMKVKDGDEMKATMGLDSSGKGVLYLVEEDADYYAQNGKERTVIHSVKESGNPNGLGFSRFPPVATFYENNVDPMRGAAQRGFISPISDNAISYYKFKYEGEFRQDGYVIDKITVTPRRLYEPLLSGTIYIVEDDWAIHSLSLLATKTANLETLDTLHIEQTFLPLKKDTWVVKNQLLYPTINLFGFNISAQFLTVYDRQKVNEAIPDTIFNNKIVSKYDNDANKKDSSYWLNNRPIPLQEDESKDYVVKDSLREKFSNPHYIDSMRRVANRFKPANLLMSGIHYDSRGYKNSFSTNAILSVYNPLVSFNSVEGVVVAPKLWWEHEIDTYRHINTIIAARYGFSSERFNAIGRVAYRQNRKDWRGRWWEIGVEGGRYVHQFNSNSTLTPLYNTVSTLLYARNYMKLYERYTAGAFFQKNYGNGFRWNVGASFQKRMPLVNTNTYSFSDKADERLTINLPGSYQPAPSGEHNAVIAKAGISFRPGYTYTQYPGYKQPNGSNMPLFSLNYEMGIPDLLDSKSDFSKWRFGIEDVLRLKLLGELSYNIAAGGFLNDNYASIADMTHFGENQLIVAAPYVSSFQLMPYYLYSNTAALYGELHVEYALKGLLTNKIPLLRQAQWYLVLANNTFYIDENNYYTETSIGVDNLGYKWARFLRVDFVQSWDFLGQNKMGFRIGLKPGGMFSVNVRRNDNTDW
jgi:hypothetical protein